MSYNISIFEILMIQTILSIIFIIPIKNYITYNNSPELDEEMNDPQIGVQQLVDQQNKTKKSSITIEINFKHNWLWLLHKTGIKIDLKIISFPLKTNFYYQNAN